MHRLRGVPAPEPSGLPGASSASVTPTSTAEHQLCIVGWLILGPVQEVAISPTDTPARLADFAECIDKEPLCQCASASNRRAVLEVL